jgi:hypothetical protein
LFSASKIEYYAPLKIFKPLPLWDTVATIAENSNEVGN